MHDCFEILGNVVRNTRMDLHLTQNDVADRIDVDVRTILNIENYKGNPKYEILYPLIRELKIDPTTIFYPEQNTDRASILKFRQLLSQCTDNEAESLYTICETVLSVIRSTNYVQIEEK